MEKHVYPAVFTPEDDGYLVRFPDIPNCFTDGNSMLKATEMAKDALRLMLYDYQQKGQAIPTASVPTDILLDHGEFITMIACEL